MNNKPLRHRYDTSVVLLYTQRKEHLLPEHFRRSVPHSTASTWRKENVSDFKGSQFRSMHNEAFEWYELFLTYQKLRKTVRMLCRVWITLAGIVKPLLNAKQYSQIVFDEMQKLFTVIPKRLACKLTGWSPAAFRYRSEKIQCCVSPRALCFTRYPTQLALREVSLIKDLMKRPELVCWPVSSIAWYAKRENILSISLSTWYKYINLLGLKRRFIRPPDKTKGIVSTAPNQFLHVDTTFYPLPDAKPLSSLYPIIFPNIFSDGAVR